MSLQPSQTFVNNDRQLYALASESASKWYTFPSLTGEVLLVDASGTQTLQSVDGNLFYNQELLARANDIQLLSEWSDYPVLNPAGVDFNGNPLLNATTIEATGDISGGGNLSLLNGQIQAGSLIVTGGIDTTTSGIITTAITTKGGGALTNGDVTTTTVTASGAISAGSVASTGAVSGTSISGTSLATTGGLDMANTAITRASAVNISNAGFAPYGQLTSPNGTQLLWNGATIQTGGGGDVSQWANFNAVAPINANSNPITNVTTIGASGNITTATNVNAFAFNGTNVEATNIAAGPIGSGKFCIMTNNSITSSTTDGLTISVPSNNLVTTVASGNITNTATGIVNNVANNFEITADGGLNPLVTPNIDLTAKNGNGGQVNLVADPGSIAAFGGVVNITGNGGTITIPQPPPELPISVTVGGEVNITANTGSGAGLYTATSAINLNAAAINSYAGAIPSIGSLLGYNTVFGNLGVSICAGLPPSGIQFPGTVYVYGLGIPGVAGGVRLESPQGIQMLSDTYCQTLYPLDGDDLTIQGRSLPTGYVNIKDVAVFEMTGFGHLKTDFINSKSGNGLFYEDTLKPLPGVPNPGIEAFTLKPPLASSASSPNLVISNNPFPLLGYNNFVEIANATTIAFDVSGSGALSGVQSINGASWPPPTGDASLWSQYNQTSVLDSSGYGIINLSTINGQPVGDLTPAGWAAFNAIQAVDMSANNVNNVGGINTVAGATITSAGALNIFSDASGDLSIASNGGGNVNIGTGNAGDINISTGGAGNEVTIGGDVVNLSATVGVRVSAPVLDMEANNIYNVATLRGSLGTDLRVVADGAGNLGLEGTIITLTAPTKVLVDSPSVDANGADIINVANVTNEGINVLTVQSTVNLIVSAETNLSLVSDSADVTIQSQTGVAIYAATGNVNLTADSGEIVVQDSVLNMNSHKITNVTAGTAAADAVNYGQLTFRDSTEFYVSSQGSDISNNGSILAPFLTIQKAITQAELISSAALVCSINVASGHYTENLTFNKGYVVLNGTLQSQTGNEVCEITGSITINCTGPNDVFNRQISWQGWNITCGAGQSITNTSTSSHTVSFQDCKIFVNSVCYNSTASCADARTYFTNVEVFSTNAANVSPVITTNVGLVELERMDLTVDGNAIGILIGGTSVLSRFSLSTLENTNTGTTLLPLLSFTSTTTSAHSLGNVAFAFTSAVAKTATNAVYINSGINTAMIMLNNVFTLAGTASSTNYCIGYNGVGTPTIAGINNTSLSVNVVLPQTTATQPGITSIQYTNIDPPVLGTYSSSIDQTMAVGSTPQALTFNTSQNYHGTLLVAGTRIYVGSQGNYAINYACQLQNTGGLSIFTQTFLKKNGALVANSTSNATITTTTAYLQTSPQIVVSMNGGDYIEVWMNGPVTLSINSQPATGTVPASPSVLLNIAQIR